MSSSSSKQSSEISKGSSICKSIKSAATDGGDVDSVSGRGSNAESGLEIGQVTNPIESAEDGNEPNGFSIQRFVQLAKEKGQRGLVLEYEQMVAATEKLTGTCNMGKKRLNLNKNRYLDVPCYDSTRVILSPGEPSTPTTDVEACSDYIHANFVEGYNQKNAYIATQGPLPNTCSDFWKMVWEQTTVVIVMVTKIIEMGRIKSGQYWPVEQGDSTTYENYKVKNMDINLTNPELRITQLKLTAVEQDESRIITHLQFVSWPDFGTPANPSIMLNLLQVMRTEQSLGVARLGNNWNGEASGPPIIVHCSAGLGRTGTLITIDICTKQIVGGERIDIRQIVEKLRSQRALSIQSSDQYLFCYATVIAFIRQKELLPAADLDSISTL